MPQPRLIHPVDVEIKKISRATTRYDEDAREPIQQAARATAVVVKGQPNSSLRAMATKPARAGRREEEDGYVLFRKRDLDRASIELEDGDLITRVGHLAVDFYVDRLEWIGNYPDTNGPSLVKAWAKDRKPAKARPA